MEDIERIKQVPPPRSWPHFLAIYVLVPTATVAATALTVQALWTNRQRLWTGLTSWRR